MTLRIKGATTIKGLTSVNWSPNLLFAAGEQGVWYDPSDFSTMFQDTAGTTPVTATGQSVARINDKSGRGNNATQSTSGQRPTLQQDASGKYYLSFDGSDDLMTVSGSASTMKFMHSAVSSVCAGATFGNNSDPNTFVPLFGTNNGASSNVGSSFLYDDRASVSRNNSLAILTTNSSSPGFQQVINAIDQNIISPNTATVIFYNADPANATAANRYFIYVNTGSALNTNAVNNALSTSNSTFDMQIAGLGSSTTTTAPLRLYGLVMVNSTLSTSSRQLLQNWMNSKTAAY